jgi:hypothetical protein
VNDVRQRQPRLLLPALTRSARGMPCTFRVDEVCNHDDATTVWAHSNEERHGKGKGLKAHDCFGAWACFSCHEWYDRNRGPVRDAAFARARDRTLYELFARGKLKVVP